MAGGKKRKKGGGAIACCGSSPRAHELPVQQPPSEQAAVDRGGPGTPPGSPPRTPPRTRVSASSGPESTSKSSAIGATSEQAASSPAEGVPPTIAEGWLWKAGEHHTAWKRRWFKLDAEAKSLRYFVDEKHATKHREKGHIDLNDVSEVSIRSVSGAAKDFDIVTSNRTYHLRADEAQGETVAGRWVTTLKSLASRPRAGRETEIEVASQRFKEAQSAHRLVKDKSGDARQSEAAAQRLKGNAKQADESTKSTRSGVCMGVPVVPVSPWSARDPKPSHVLGYDSPRAHNLGYLGDKGRVPSHRLRYLPK